MLLTEKSKVKFFCSLDWENFSEVFSKDVVHEKFDRQGLREPKYTVIDYGDSGYVLGYTNQKLKYSPTYSAASYLIEVIESDKFIFIQDIPGTQDFYILDVNGANISQDSDKLITIKEIDNYSDEGKDVYASEGAVARIKESKQIEDFEYNSFNLFDYSKKNGVPSRHKLEAPNEGRNKLINWGIILIVFAGLMFGGHWIYYKYIKQEPVVAKVDLEAEARERAKKLRREQETYVNNFLKPRTGGDLPSQIISECKSTIGKLPVSFGGWRVGNYNCGRPEGSTNRTQFANVTFLRRNHTLSKDEFDKLAKERGFTSATGYGDNKQFSSTLGLSVGDVKQRESLTYSDLPSKQKMKDYLVYLSVPFVDRGCKFEIIHKPLAKPSTDSPDLPPDLQVNFDTVSISCNYKMFNDMHSYLESIDIPNASFVNMFVTLIKGNPTMNINLSIASVEQESI